MLLQSDALVKGANAVLGMTCERTGRGDTVTVGRSLGSVGLPDTRVEGRGVKRGGGGPRYLQPPYTMRIAVLHTFFFFFVHIIVTQLHTDNYLVRLCRFIYEYANFNLSQTYVLTLDL
jgi:hypothetical protein